MPMPTPGVIVYRYQWNGIVLFQLSDQMDPTVTAAASVPAPLPVIDIGLSVNSNTSKQDLDAAMARQGWSFLEANPAVDPPAAGYCLELLANTTTQNVALTNTPLSFPVAPGDVWKVEIDLTAQASIGLGLLYAIAAPAGSILEGWAESGTPAAATGVETLIAQELTAVNTATAIPAHAGGGGLTVRGRDHFWFTITIPAGAPAGSQVVLQIANVPGATQTATLAAGSQLTATPATGV